MPAKTAINAAIFDMGGVLLRLHPQEVFAIWSRASGVSTQTIQARWSIDEYYKAYETGQMSFDAYTRCLTNQLGIHMTVAEWREGWNALVGQPFELVFAQLKELASLIPLYCFTNSNPEHEIVFLANYAEALSVFRHIFNSSTLGCRKPDVDAFEAVLKLIDAKPDTVLFVDDIETNVDGATLAGLNAYRSSRPQDTVALIEKVIASKQR